MTQHKTINDMLINDKTSMMTKEARDMVNNPKHYNTGEIECIDAIDSMLTSEEFIGYLRGNSLKYRWRFRYKNGIEDLKKAEWYENKLLKVLEEK
tara:strand:- start:103 stop:387 length:285 start_codon:yes stop_codon:yes gene_type:complete